MSAAHRFLSSILLVSPYGTDHDGAVAHTARQHYSSWTRRNRRDAIPCTSLDALYKSRRGIRIAARGPRRYRADPPPSPGSLPIPLKPLSIIYPAHNRYTQRPSERLSTTAHDQPTYHSTSSAHEPTKNSPFAVNQ